MENKKEYRVYVLHSSETESDMTTEQIQDRAEKTGFVYTLWGFQEAINSGDLSVDESFIFFIEV